MAELDVDEQGIPATPGGSANILFPSTATKQWGSKDTTGKVLTLHGVKNYNTSDVVANGADTLLTGSTLAIPPWGLQVGTILRWRIAMTKTAAGIATPVWNLRLGTAGTVSDAARCVFTSASAQTAATDTAEVEITAIVRSLGVANGVLAGILSLAHVTNAGFSNALGVLVQTTSAAFDSTVASLIASISVNPGTSGVWTHQLVMAEAFNI